VTLGDDFPMIVKPRDLYNWALSVGGREEGKPW